MASALADLFSEASPPRAAPSRSPARSPSHSPTRNLTSDNPLFFSPGDTPDRRPQASTSRLPSPPRPIDFDARGSSPFVPVSNGQSRSTQNGIDSRSNGGVAFDPLDMDGAYGEAQEALGLAEEDQPAGKKRRIMAKVDVDRLMGEKGFPALMKSAKRFKPKGKGHEAKDLRDILNVYQLWAHGMFPKGDFEGTIKRVETICRTRRMEIAMKGYRDAFYPPPPRSPSPPGLSPLHTSPAPPASDAPLGDHDNAPPRSEPLFDQSEEMDGPDMEELMAMEEMERNVFGASGAVNVEQEATGGGVSVHPDVPEEDEWEGLYD